MTTITGTVITHGITLGLVTGGGTYAAFPFTITSTGTVENSSGTAVYGPDTYAWTITNAGTILGGTASSTGIGVAFKFGGTVSNSGLIQGYSGIKLYNGSSDLVTNSGTIEATGKDGDGVNLDVGGTIVNSGTILSAATDYTIFMADGGYVTNSQSGYIGSGGIEIGNATSTIVNDGRIVDAGGNAIYIYSGSPTITNAGTLDGSSNGIFLKPGGTVIDSGTISGGNGTAINFGGTGGNLLVLRHGYSLGGGKIVGSSTSGATNTLDLGGSLGAGVTVGYNALGLTNFHDVLFGAPGYDTLKITNDATLPGTISGFTLTSDTIDLTGVTFAGTTSVPLNSGTLTVTEGTNTVHLKLGTASYSGITWVAHSDGSTGTDVRVACFCRGTLILAENGEVPVEDLAIGDRVIAVSGAARPIKWIGRRAYDGRFVAANRAVLPIRVEAGALADGMPARDLLVSPEHALYLDGALVPAGLLTNGTTIRQVEEVERIEYFHIELDGHDIIFAEGAAAESFVDCDNRGMFQNAGEFAALYPDDAPAPWQFCAARLAATSPGLAEIRAAIRSRAEALGHLLTDDPDLHLIADGAVVRPDAVAGGVYRFVIPAGSTVVELASRSVIPAEAGSRDLRRLGVAVERIALSDGELSIEAWHRHAGLCEGFHEDEGSHRWTDGLGRLPDTWLRSFSGAVTLEVHLIASGLSYRVAESPLPDGARFPVVERLADGG